MATICDNIVEPTISDPRVSRISIGSIQQIGFFNNNLTATIALDSGAEANCITVRECRRLNVPPAHPFSVSDRGLMACSVYSCLISSEGIF